MDMMLDQNQIASAAAGLNNASAWAFVKVAVSSKGHSGRAAASLTAEIWEIVRMERVARKNSSVTSP